MFEIFCPYCLIFELVFLLSSTSNILGRIDEALDTSAHLLEFWKKRDVQLICADEERFVYGFPISSRGRDRLILTFNPDTLSSFLLDRFLKLVRFGLRH